MLTEDDLYKLLNTKSIPYEVCHHEAVFTVTQADKIEMSIPGIRTKNLFLYDKRGHFWLVVLPKDARCNLKELRHTLGAHHLSFASEELLQKRVGLIAGAVTPIGVLNDQSCEVVVVFDESLAHQVIDLHPFVNTATMAMRIDDLVSLIGEHGNPVRFCDVTGTRQCER